MNRFSQGLMLIEEGVVRGNAIKLELKFKRSIFGPEHGPKAVSSQRFLYPLTVLDVLPGS